MSSIRYIFAAGIFPHNFLKFLHMSKGNFATNTLTGKLGAYVFMRRKGQQVARSLVVPADAKTVYQGIQRTKLANPVSLYRTFSGALKNAFENKKSNQSDFNAFISIALKESPTVYFTKALADRSACVLAPYTVSRGTLRSLIVSNSPAVETGWYLGINVGAVNLETASVAEASAALVEGSNGVLQDGDAITIIACLQSTIIFPGLSVPRVRADVQTFTIDVNSSAENIRSQFNATAWLAASESGDAYVNFPAGNSGALAVIVSRNTDSGIKVSSQQLVMGTEGNMYEQYIDEDAAREAAASYGNTNTIQLAPEREFVG